MNSACVGPFHNYFDLDFVRHATFQIFSNNFGEYTNGYILSAEMIQCKEKRDRCSVNTRNRKIILILSLGMHF